MLQAVPFKAPRISGQLATWERLPVILCGNPPSIPAACFVFELFVLSEFAVGNLPVVKFYARNIFCFLLSPNLLLTSEESIKSLKTFFSQLIKLG